VKCRAAWRLKRRLGRRGAILTCYGLVWVLYGYGQLVIPQTDQRGLKTLLGWMPLSAWAWCWIAAGLVALVCAWAPPGRDTAAFFVLPLPAAAWMATYFAAWLIDGLSRAWVAAAVWAVITAPVLVVAGWPEPPRAKRAEPPYES
jgi:hypothetical protein